jgi:hypothetical protein
MIFCEWYAIRLKPPKKLSKIQMDPLQWRFQVNQHWFHVGLDELYWFHSLLINK